MAVYLAPIWLAKRSGSPVRRHLVVRTTQKSELPRAADKDPVACAIMILIPAVVIIRHRQFYTVFVQILRPYVRFYMFAYLCSSQ